MVVAQRILSFLRHILPYTNLVCGGHSCQAIFVVLSMVYNKLHISSYIWNMINWLLNLKWNLSVSLEFIAVLSISTFYSICERRWSLHDQLFVLYRTHICFLWLLILCMQEDFQVRRSQYHSFKYGWEMAENILTARGDSFEYLWKIDNQKKCLVLTLFCLQDKFF